MNKILKFFACLVLGLTCAWAQAKPLKIIVSYPAGGSADGLARILEKGLKDRGVDAVIINRPAAEGVLSIRELLDSPADGTTVLMSGTGPVILKSLEDSRNLVAVRSMIPVITTAHFSSLIVASPKSNIRNWRDVQTALSTRPLNVATGSANTRNIILEVLGRNNPNVNIIPYNGDTPIIPAVINGTVDLAIATFPSLATHALAGSMVPIALTSDSGRQGIRSLREQGVNFSSQTFYGIWVAPHTPADKINELNQIFAQVLTDPQIRESITNRFMTPATSLQTKDLKNLVDQELIRWNRILFQ